MHLKSRHLEQGSDMEKDDLLTKRIQELANLADRRSCVTFTDFLNLNEQNILHQTVQKFSWIHGETFGGYEGAERQMAAFVPDTLAYDWEYPIACVRIGPLNIKFAETLTHRDILGALMNLGIDRAKTGDIALCEHGFYLFCHSTLASIICDELTRIRHTSVRCSVCDLSDFSYVPKTETTRGSVASTRLDSVMALAFHASRSSLLSLIEDGKVFVNGKLILSNAYTLKDNDIVSVRGHGKFCYTGTIGQTKKGRCMIEIKKYV